MADPDTLAEVPAIVDPEDDWEGVECEDMLSVAWDAHRAATGEQLPADSWSVTYPQLDAESDFDFDDEDEMRRRLPRLAALCYDRADTDSDDPDDPDDSDDSEDALDEADLADDDLDEDDLDDARSGRRAG